MATDNKYWIYLERLKRAGVESASGRVRYLISEYRGELSESDAESVYAEWEKKYNPNDYDVLGYETNGQHYRKASIDELKADGVEADFDSISDEQLIDLYIENRKKKYGHFCRHCETCPNYLVCSLEGIGCDDESKFREMFVEVLNDEDYYDEDM